MDGSSILGLGAFLAMNVAAASSGAIFGPGDWYESLARPWWRPPNWLFAPAWTLLYVMNAVAGWLVWDKVGVAGAALPLAVYVMSLLLNAGWSAVFFGMRRPDLAFAELTLLWLSVLAVILLFRPLHEGAAWLLVPYLCWVTFAGALNFAIWRMNRGVVARS
jgi:benzodiazapine receptor